MFAGVAVGVIAAALQFWLVTPLLLEGELYETGARVHFSTDGSTQSEAGHPALFTEPMRDLMTVGFNMVAFTGFALFLAVGFALSERGGHMVTARKGLIWGMAGFIAVQLAPAIGLPPELPGTVAADVELRQIWWICTVLVTAVGLGLIAFGPTLAGVGGAVLIALPHLIGAPHLDTYFGVAAPELAAHFATASLGTSAATWVLLGLFTATLWVKFKDA
ncbi:putative cobalt transporter CbtA [Litoreibacter arenae DSM 19593]|uniref:Putative cobalt transporter CbtA n=1 Tax=Litoreibacter arenae DSM 19593 TaxID=1123360 RepID=S9QBC7_9RHOB|nr:putative cobalt transporter CbtA [Litoreibacter arenae DSM 19593]